MPLDNEAGTTPDTAESSMRDTYADSLGAALAESTDDAATNNVSDTPLSGDKEAPSVDTETAEQKADRLRDEKGRFAAEDKTEPKDAPVVAPAAPKIQRPSSWKKDHWEAFDKLAAENPALANYIHQREGEFATGVSTYKTEFERVKPLDDAMQPIMPILQQFGRDPAEWIQTMARVHQTFATGTPQQRVQATLKLLQDYNVPLGDYLTQGGQLPQFNPNQPQPQPVAQQQPDVRALVQAELQAHDMQQQVHQFSVAKDAQGNPKYPHFSTVRADMIGLLQAGLAKDLEGAYDKAVRTHDDLWQQQQEAKATADAADKAAQAQAKVDRARRNAVSVKDSTRSSNMSSGGDKELRTTYAEALGSADGRV